MRDEQALLVYVRMITDVLERQGYPIDSVYQCNSIAGRYLVIGGDAYACDEDGNQINPDWDDGGYEGDIDYTNYAIDGWTGLENCQ